MSNILIQKKIRRENIEFVERKGVGHPDTICDAIAEKCSQKYSRYCYEKFGKFAHHWFDKVTLIGGESNIDYGKGELLKPYKIIIAGKCVKKVGAELIPLDSIFRRAVLEVLENVLTNFNPDKHIEIIDETVDHQGAGRRKSRYQPESIDDLVDINTDKFVSNDCNLLSSHYPLTDLENLVITTERYINGSEFKKSHPYSGWDVKIIGTKNDDSFNLLINIPMLSEYLVDRVDYKEKVAMCKKDIQKYIKKIFNFSIELNVNPQDNTGNPYITVLGSAADTGDVGVVGRGNRINGLITPMQSMSIEAPSGKNPLDHTGKIYGILAERLAKSLYMHLGIGVEIHIYTYKEAPLKFPDKIIVNILEDHKEIDEDSIRNIISDKLENIDNILNDLIFKDNIMW